jgi:hypothetical protein
MSNVRELYPQKKAAPAQEATPTWSGLVARLNDPHLFAVVFFCLFCLFCLISLLLTVSRPSRNEWYVATDPDEAERPGQVVASERDISCCDHISDCGYHRLAQ